MKVFISWSGDRSKEIAKALHDWIPDVIQQAKPWMSAEDIGAGARWSHEIASELEKAKFGILCITPENQVAPWILFEAGALGKALDKTFVCPYLYDLASSDLSDNPLTQFQAKEADESGTWRLIRTINVALGTGNLSEEQLRRSFEQWWPDLNDKLGQIPDAADEIAHERPMEDTLKEILETVREIARTASTAGPPHPCSPLLQDVLTHLRAEALRRAFNEAGVQSQDRAQEHSAKLESVEVLYDASVSGRGTRGAAGGEL